jgi:hypothetical protein
MACRGLPAWSVTLSAYFQATDCQASLHSPDAVNRPINGSNIEVAFREKASVTLYVPSGLPQGRRSRLQIP